MNPGEAPGVMRESPHGFHDPHRRVLVPVPRVPCPAAADQRRGRAHRRAVRRGQHAARHAEGRRRLRGLRAGCLRPDLPRRDVRPVQGQPPADARRPAQPGRTDAGHRRGPGIPDPARARRRGRRRHRHPGATGRGPGHRGGHLHRRQGLRAAGRRARHPGQHHDQHAHRRSRREGEVRRAARAHRRLPGADRRQGRQRARRGQVRAQDRRQVAGQVRHAGCADGPGRRGRRQDRREPARGAGPPAALARPGDHQDRRRAGRRPHRPEPARGRRRAPARAVHALRVSRRAQGPGQRPGGRTGTAAHARPSRRHVCATPPRHRMRTTPWPPPAATNWSPRASSSTPGSKRIETADLVAFDTETTSLDAMRAQVVGVSLAVEPGTAAYIPVAHDYPGAPEQLGRDEVLAALGPVLEDPDRPKLAQHGKYDINVLAGHGVAVRGPGPRHHARVLRVERHRHAPRHGLAGRSATWATPPPSTATSPARAPSRSALPRSTWIPPATTPPRTPTSRFACTACCGRSCNRSRA